MAEINPLKLMEEFENGKKYGFDLAVSTVRGYLSGTRDRPDLPPDQVQAQVATLEHLMNILLDARAKMETA